MIYYFTAVNDPRVQTKEISILSIKRTKNNKEYPKTMLFELCFKFSFTNICSSTIWFKNSAVEGSGYNTGRINKTFNIK